MAGEMEVSNMSFHSNTWVTFNEEMMRSFYIFYHTPRAQMQTLLYSQQLSPIKKDLHH
jgi:hypothetical protein